MLLSPTHLRSTLQQQRVGNSPSATRELQAPDVNKLKQEAWEKLPAILDQLRTLIAQLKTISPRDLASSPELQNTHTQCQQKWRELCSQIGNDSYILELQRQNEEFRNLTSEVTTLLTTIRDYKPSLPLRAFDFAKRVLAKLRP